MLRKRDTVYVRQIRGSCLNPLVAAFCHSRGGQKLHGSVVLWPRQGREKRRCRELSHPRLPHTQVLSDYVRVVELFLRGHSPSFRLTPIVSPGRSLFSAGARCGRHGDQDG